MEDINQEVIMRAKEGDADAFEEILRTYGDVVFNVSLRFLGNREDAKEVSQEVFLIMYKKLKDFQGRSSLTTWLYRITVNTAINYSKRVAKMKKRSVEFDENHEISTKNTVIQDLVDNEYARNVVDKLLGMLSEEQRVCIVLRNVEGLSYAEIANTLGIDINSVRSRLKRARDKMLSMKKGVMSNAL